MAGYARRWDEGAHRERIDERVVELLVLKDGRGRDGAFRAGAGVRRVVDEAVGEWVDADAVLRGVFEKGFGVNRSGEVHVEIAALRHFAEEGFEGESVRLPGPGSVEELRGSVLACCG